MSFLEDLATTLNTSGVVVYPGTSATRTCFLGEMPDIPDLCVALYARSGRRRTLYWGGELQNPELHVEVRAATYSAAVTKLEAVVAALHGQANVELNGHDYVYIFVLSEMTPLGKDGRNRTIVSQNFEIKKA